MLFRFLLAFFAFGLYNRTNNAHKGEFFMKIKRIGEPRVIMSNENSRHKYFAWPTARRLKNGRIAAVASGYRLSHICPFGKTVISYSENEGETYTLPAAVIDTPLDDRDGGILAFGESGVIVTSFNNTADMQRKHMHNRYNLAGEGEEAERKLMADFRNAYLDYLTPEEEEKYLAASFRVSFDNGVTFGPIYKSPITSPHGPLELKNGKIIWIGRSFITERNFEAVEDKLSVYEINPENGEMTYIGEIEQIFDGEDKLLSCEPDTVELDDGTLICHIRAQGGQRRFFTIYQSESYDGGKTWTKPHQLLERRGGAPSHILKLADGTLVATYGYREEPAGIKAMISTDGAKTWETGLDVYVNGVSFDIGYPSTVELKDGSFITVFYAHTEDGGPARIMQQHWAIEK